MNNQEDAGLVVFLAHSSGDKERVRQLDALLSLDGFRPWLDERSLVAGQDWELEIEKAVQGADAIVVFLSERAVTAAGYLHTEVGLALRVAERQPEGAILIVPIRLDAFDVPTRLRHLHWIDVSHLNRFRFNSKTAYIYAYRLGHENWETFTIGESYLRLQHALLLRSEQLERREMLANERLWREDGGVVQLCERYLIHGRDPNGQEYYGKASVTTRQTDAREQAVTVCSQIGTERYDYEGTFNGLLLSLSGSHDVSYLLCGTNGLLVGSWEHNGLEELIPAANALIE